MTDEPLKFRVAPHIVEDLGLNLYTSLPRVLVEFVANAYDADSKFVDISYDRQAIDKHRRAIKAEFDREVALQKDGTTPPALGERVMPAEVQIVIRDAGIGMSREDLREKFLVAGRRRRLDVDPSTPELATATPGGRALMGRKGLGKLAGFGVAKTVTVVSRARGASVATKVTLNYDELIKSRTMHEIIVPDESLDAPSLLADGGTIITLSRLLYDPTKARDTSIENEIADHFAAIDPADFEIRVNTQTVAPTPVELVYAYPNPELDVHELVSHHLDGTEDEPFSIDFRYRVRFTKKSLRAAKRGMRVYANKRLAAAPSLLDASTGIHGFRMSDYLDGIVYAEFIDQQTTDYIATDRHGLRWDAPMLAAMRAFLSDEMTEGCKWYQKFRDEGKEKEARNDPFTKSLIDKSGLRGSERKTASRIARELAKAYDGGVEDNSYRTTLPGIVQAIGHGGILSAIAKIADTERPQLAKLVVEITRLTADELENFTRRAKARLDAIRALKKIVEAVDFKAPDNEKEAQKLFEKSPWLIDATYTQFLSADEREDSLFERLRKHLQIGTHAAANHANKRPDLVFLLGNTGLGRLVIVELKSPNLPLDSQHLQQLDIYMDDASQWLSKQGYAAMKVEGHLIGSLGKPSSGSVDVQALDVRMRREGPSAPWKVRDYLQVLADTEAAHKELLAVQASTARAEDDDDDDDDENLA